MGSGKNAFGAHLLHRRQQLKAASLLQHESMRQVVDVLRCASKMRELQNLRCQTWNTLAYFTYILILLVIVCMQQDVGCISYFFSYILILLVIGYNKM